MKSFLLVLVFLFSITTTSPKAQAIKPEDIVPDIGDYDIVKVFKCVPDGYQTTMDCLVIRKGDQEYGSIHDPNTRECQEIRDSNRKTIWKKGWVFT